MIDHPVLVTTRRPESPTHFAESKTLAVGGPVRNLAVALLSSGVDTRVYAFVGRADRRFVNQELRKLPGIQATLTEHDGYTDTLLRLCGDGHDRFYYQPAAVDSNIVLSAFASVQPCNIAVLSGSRHESVRRVYVEIGHEFKCEELIWAPNYAAFEYRNDELEGVLRTAHIAILNTTEAIFVAATIGMDNQLIANTFGIALIVTEGKAGLSLYRPGAPPTPIRPRHGPRVEGDFLGAGDCLLAAFISGRHRGETMVEALNRGIDSARKFVQCKAGH